MKAKARHTLLFLSVLSFNLLYGQTLKDTAVLDYSIVNETVTEKVRKFGAANLLVVMDIDNTILTGGVTVFALTSRSPKYRAATERELLRNNIDLSRSELRTNDGNELSFYYTLSRDLSYDNGIMMTTGMNKGEMLSHILGRSGRTFRALIFIDDTRKNIDAVKTSYSTCNNLDIVLFHYTKISSERLKQNDNVVLTPEQAKKMDRDWDKLIRTLNKMFPERMAKSECAK